MVLSEDTNYPESFVAAHGQQNPSEIEKSKTDEVLWVSLKNQYSYAYHANV